MRLRLLWKLLLINVLPVIAGIFLIVWFALDQLAAKYFMALMKKYEVASDDIHHMFVSSIHYYLVWACIAGLILAFLLSFLLTRRVLRPLSQMTAITREVSAGNYSLRVATSSQDEIGELAVAFNRMADSLEKVERLRKNMVSDVAHELRTPLTNLRGYLEAFTDGVIPPTPETLDMLQQEILRLVQLVESLQQLARADAARAFLKRKPLRMSELISRLLALHQLNVQQKELLVDIDFCSDEPEIHGDEDKLLQAFQSLMENCIKYTPRAGRIRIRIAPDPAGMLVEFANSGAQIPAADLPYIFERFFRADPSRSREGGGGAGIGLAITKELIEAHGGQVGAQSGNGLTRIWAILPV